MHEELMSFELNLAKKSLVCLPFTTFSLSHGLIHHSTINYVCRFNTSDLKIQKFMRWNFLKLLYSWNHKKIYEWKGLKKGLYNQHWLGSLVWIIIVMIKFQITDQQFPRSHKFYINFIKLSYFQLLLKVVHNSSQKVVVVVMNKTKEKVLLRKVMRL